MKRTVDIAIIGAGVLGASISYWLARRHNASICVIEAEPEPACHASGRNTGVAHSPFYLDPDFHKGMAVSMLTSIPMWKKLAAKTGVIWSEIGVLEVANTESENQTLEKHMKWAQTNGVPDGTLELLSQSEVAKDEPNVKCTGALRNKSEVATDFGALTIELAKEAKEAGVEFLFDSSVQFIQRTKSETKIQCKNGLEVDAKFVINCAGGSALDIAKMADQAKGYTALHFRGEYWGADSAHAGLVGTSVYSVPRYSDYPFLDPHWIVRADKSVEIGPNAVPVAGPTTYKGGGSMSDSVSKILEILSSNTRKLVFDATFLSMAKTELHSSLSKSAMVSRIKDFVPAVRPEMFSKKGRPGIRTPLVTPKGKLAVGTIELVEDTFCSIINYNSPGATGAPAYAARLVQRFEEKGILGSAVDNKQGGIWGQDDLLRQD